MTVRLYQSKDVGAPELSSTTAGSLVTILRACLVDGYGTRTPQGWLMPFSDLPNNVACFKPASIGDTIRVDDGIDYRYAQCRGYATMSDLNTGTEMYPSLGNVIETSFKQWKRGDANVLKDGWMVVAGDNWFYFINHDDSYSYPAGFYFGAYDCVNASFANNYIINGYYGSANPSVSYADDGLYVAGVKKWWARRNYQDSANPVNLDHYWSAQNYANPNPFNGSLEFMECELRSYSAPIVRYGKLMNHTRLNAGSRLDQDFGNKFVSNLRNYVIYAAATSAFAIEFDEDAG